MLSGPAEQERAQRSAPQRNATHRTAVCDPTRRRCGAFFFSLLLLLLLLRESRSSATSNSAQPPKKAHAHEEETALGFKLSDCAFTHFIFNSTTLPAGLVSPRGVGVFCLEDRPPQCSSGSSSPGSSIAAPPWIYFVSSLWRRTRRTRNPRAAPVKVTEEKKGITHRGIHTHTLAVGLTGCVCVMHRTS